MKRLLTTLLAATVFASAEANDTQCNNYCGLNGEISADLLYWKLCSDGYEWAREERTGADGITHITRYNANPDWKLGLKLAASTQLNCPDWTAFADWTWFQPSTSEKANFDITAPTTQTVTGIITEAISTLAPATYTGSGKTHHDFRYNLFNVGILKECCWCEWLRFVPSASFTYLSITDQIKSRWVTTQPSIYQENIRVTHHAFGADTSLGILWGICDGFVAKTRFGMMTLWDSRHTRVRTQRPVSPLITTGSRKENSSTYCGLFIPHLEVGMDYNDCWCGYAMNAHLGWSYQVLFDEVVFKILQTEHATIQGLNAGVSVAF